MGGSEPWFGQDDNAAATLNTENIYTMGRVGIGDTTPDATLSIADTGNQVDIGS